MRRQSAYVDMPVFYSSPYFMGLEMIGYGMFSVPMASLSGQKLHAVVKSLNEVARPMTVNAVIPPLGGIALTAGLWILLYYELPVPTNYVVAFLACIAVICFTFVIRFRLISREVHAFADRLRQQTQLQVDIIPLNMGYLRGGRYGFRMSMSESMQIRAIIPNGRRLVSDGEQTGSESDVTSPRSPKSMTSDTALGSPKLCENSSFRRKLQTAEKAAVHEAAENFQTINLNIVAVKVREKRWTLPQLKRFTDLDWFAEFPINTTQLRTIKESLKKWTLGEDDGMEDHQLPCRKIAPQRTIHESAFR